MKMGWITLHVRDMERSIAFYKALAGLEVLRRFNPGAGEIAFLGDADGGTQLELIQFAEAEKVSARGLTLSFEAGAALEEVRALALEMGCAPGEIVYRAPKPACFALRDPDGVTVEFSR